MQRVLSRQCERDLWLCVLWTVVLIPCAAAVADESTLSVKVDKDQVRIVDQGRPVATYVFRDPEILRPYFAHLHEPGGTRVTRNHPPVEGRDRTDHATMHPGLWLAFGDVSGADFWRNRGRVVHQRFTTTPTADAGEVRFGVLNHYVSDKRVICRERAEFRISRQTDGYLLTWDSTFSSDQAFAFGDQEEMGLGVRVATPLAVVAGGEIVDAEDRRNESSVWGRSAAWCRYSGSVDGRHVGVALLCHPANPRGSWFHARDYGLLVANLFGRRAFRQGDASRLDVEPPAHFRLRYGVYWSGRSDNRRPDTDQIFREYLKLTGK